MNSLTAQHYLLDIKLRRDRVPNKGGSFLRAESFFNVATEIESLGVGDSYGGRSLHEQSHGEGFFALTLALTAVGDAGADA